MQTRKFNLRPMLPVLTALALTGCAGSAVISAANSPCADLVPQGWRDGVKHAPPPAQKADVLDQLKEWIGFGTAEAANVEKANGRTADAIGIIERCEARDRDAVKRSRPKFLGIFG